MTNLNKQHNALEPLLTEADVSKILGCSVRTVRRRIKAGELAVVRDGRMVRVQPEDLNRYIRNRRFG
jgi:excisionase family DNA binding protein